jgi:hypothetical protein
MEEKQKENDKKPKKPSSSDKPKPDEGINWTDVSWTWEDDKAQTLVALVDSFKVKDKLLNKYNYKDLRSFATQLGLTPGSKAKKEDIINLFKMRVEMKESYARQDKTEELQEEEESGRKQEGDTYRLINILFHDSFRTRWLDTGMKPVRSDFETGGIKHDDFWRDVRLNYVDDTNREWWCIHIYTIVVNSCHCQE